MKPNTREGGSPPSKNQALVNKEEVNELLCISNIIHILIISKYPFIISSLLISNKPYI